MGADQSNRLAEVNEGSQFFPLDRIEVAIIVFIHQDL